MENICVCIVSFYQLLHRDTVHVRHKCGHQTMWHPFWLNKFSLCCFDESSVDIVDICFYCHPHCMLSSVCVEYDGVCAAGGGLTIITMD